MFRVHVNADNEFDEPDYEYVETVGTGQPPPEYAEESEMIAALESQFLDFQYLFDDIKGAGGMCQQLAMEAHKLVPEFREKYPVGYFTKEPSATLYRPALEELHEGIWALIGAATIAVMAAIWKFVSWLRGRKGENIDVGKSSGGGGSTPPTPEKVKEQVAEVKKETEARKDATVQNAATMEKLAETAKATEAEVKNIKPDEPKEGAPKAADVPQSFDQMAYTLLERGNATRQMEVLKMSQPEQYDIIKRGRWTEMMLSLGPIITSMEAVVQQRVQTLEHILGQDLASGDPMKMKQTTSLLEKVQASIPTPGTKYKDLEALSKALSDEKAMMSHNTIKEHMKIITTSEHLAHLVKSEPYLRLLDCKVRFTEQLGQLHAIQFRIHELSQKTDSHSGQGVGSGVPHELASKFGQALRALNSDVMHLIRLQGNIENFVRHVEALITQLDSVYELVYHRLKPYLKETASQAPLPQAAEEGLKLTSEIKKRKGWLPWSHR
jgi:hypothetical protein